MIETHGIHVADRVPAKVPWNSICVSVRLHLFATLLAVGLQNMATTGIMMLRISGATSAILT